MVARRFYADEVVSVVCAPLRSPGTDAGDRHWPISPRIVRPPHPPGTTRKRKLEKVHGKVFIFIDKKRAKNCILPENALREMDL
ncbi:hypothetical protein NPIL_331521 [Nephila pilipes]|uniref:Uncharacterized protein n=1 Tax=Nephila pilipes TaxID=299642 RepID=A0A8X6P8W3_NEPPI|nr:hypothetical protein NPIL_331521 [Nephila pilipes]